MSEEKEEKKGSTIEVEGTVVDNSTSALKLVKSDSSALVKFNNQEDLLNFATLMVEQGLVPDSIKKPGHVISIIQMGQELGIGVMTALNGIHNIKGKPTLSVHLVAARLRSKNFRYRFIKDFDKVEIGKNSEGKPKYDVVTEIEFTEYFIFNGNTEKLVSNFSFSWKEAADMGLTVKDNWIKMPKIMLRNRCLVLGSRWVCPESLAGFYETSEMADTFDVSYSIDDEGNVKA